MYVLTKLLTKCDCVFSSVNLCHLLCVFFVFVIMPLQVSSILFPFIRLVSDKLVARIGFLDMGLCEHGILGYGFSCACTIYSHAVFRF